MSATTLAVVMHNATFLVEEGVPRMASRSASCEEVLELCTQLRRRGIAAFLLKGAPEELLRDLSFSGRAFLHVLPAIPESARATGLQRPFLDAVAAGDLACAVDMARASRTTWNPAEELEDDFLYLSALMSLVPDRPDAEAAQAAISRYAVLAASDEEPDMRLLTCRALVKRDATAFDEGLSAFMRQEKARYRRLASKQAIPEEEAATEGSVSAEGLALVRIAARLGMEVSADYPMVPSLARRVAWQPGAPDAWMSVGR